MFRTLNFAGFMAMKIDAFKIGFEGAAGGARVHVWAGLGERGGDCAGALLAGAGADGDGGGGGSGAERRGLAGAGWRSGPCHRSGWPLSREIPAACGNSQIP